VLDIKNFFSASYLDKQQEQPKKTLAKKVKPKPKAKKTTKAKAKKK